MIFTIPPEKLQELAQLDLLQSTTGSTNHKDLFQFPVKKQSKSDDIRMWWARLGLQLGFDWNKIKHIDLTKGLVEAEPEIRIIHA